jgi:hypothetical protein
MGDMPADFAVEDVPVAELDELALFELLPVFESLLQAATSTLSASARVNTITPCVLLFMENLLFMLCISSFGGGDC